MKPRILRTASELLERERCRRDAHAFIFGHVCTKDEHRTQEPIRRVPEEPYLRSLLDALLVSGKLLKPEDAQYALAVGHSPLWLQALWSSGLLFVEKSRQVFVTWLVCAYLLWRVKFRAHQLVLVQSKREDDAAALVFTKDPFFARMSFMEMHLPKFLQTFTFPKAGAYGHLYSPNGSHPWAIPEGGDILRSQTPSVVFSDEAAFQPEFGAAVTAALPAIKGGGQLVAVSSAEPGTFQELVEVDSISHPSNTMIPGLSERLTTGGIPVLRLHYSASEAKRPGTPAGDAWLASASEGYPGGINSPRWRKEMEIDYTALSGTKLFPLWAQWQTNRQIVMPPFDPVGYKLYGSYDHGWRHPACYLIHGMNPDGYLVTLWEFWASHVPYQMIAKIIKGESVRIPSCGSACHPSMREFPGNPYAGREQFKVADPSIWSEDKPQSDGTMKSTARLFRGEQVAFIPGERGGDTTIAEWLIGHYWRNPLAPLYRITTACPKLIWELGQQRHKDMSEAVAQNRSQPEELVDKDNDAFDSLKYFLLKFPPVPREAKAAQKPCSFAWWQKVAKEHQLGQPLPSYQRQVIA